MFIGEVAVSVDHSPVASPGLMRWVYGDFAKVEAIGWLWSQLFIDKFRRERLDVMSLHGPTGDFDVKRTIRDRMKSFVIKRLMLNTHDAIRLVETNRIPRVLVHLPEARKNRKELLRTHKTIAVENDITLKDGVGETAIFVRDLTMARGNKKTEMVVDLGHFAQSRGLVNDPNTAVEEALRLIEIIQREYKIKISLHIPFNCGGDDGGLDYTKVSLPNIKRIFEFENVIENQIDSPLRWVNPFYLIGYKKRTRMLMDWIWVAKNTIN